MHLKGRAVSAFTPGQETDIQLENNDMVHLNSNESSYASKCLKSVLRKSDSLGRVHISSLVGIHNLLRSRLHHNELYNKIGNILVATNTNQELPTSSPQLLKQYLHGSPGLPPHPFGISNDISNQISSGQSDHVVLSLGTYMRTYMRLLQYIYINYIGNSRSAKRENSTLVLIGLLETSKRQSNLIRGPALLGLEQLVLQAKFVVEGKFHAYSYPYYV